MSIPDEPRIIAKMGIIYSRPGETYRISDGFNHYNGRISIEIRGSSSQAYFEKKSYSIETQDDIGENLNVQLLGMPKENDWVLYGPFSDKSLIRNSLAYNMGLNIMEWGPRSRYCELIINNDYLGIYLLCEKIKRDKNRVDIAKLIKKDTVGDDLTGGYIIKIDKAVSAGAGEGWISPYHPDNAQNQYILFQYHYPKARNILPVQASYIENYINNFEGSLKSSTFNDPEIGYKKYIDMNSFINFFIINEVSRNVDGYRLSSFLYKKKESQGGKLYMGPVWDFNLGFGNADYCDGSNINGFSYLFNYTCSYDWFLTPFWWERFLEDSVFQNSLKTRWEELRNGYLHEDSIMNYIDSLAFLLDMPQKRNFQRWNILGEYIWPNPYIGDTYSQEVDYLKGWIKNRLVWLDTNLPVEQKDDKEPDQHKNYRVYPNPFIENITVDIGSNINFNYHLGFTLMDISGRKIYKGLVKNSILTINTTGYQKGIYVYYLEINNKIVKTGKLIKH